MARVPVHQRRQIAELCLQGYTQRAISSMTNRPLKTVNRIVKAYRDERRIKDATRKPRSRATTDQKDREIVAYVVDKPSASVQEIRANLGIQASKTTVKRRIAEAGLSSCTAVKKPLLRNDNKNKRLLFAQEHRGKMEASGVHRRVDVYDRLPSTAESLATSKCSVRIFWLSRVVRSGDM